MIRFAFKSKLSEGPWKMDGGRVTRKSGEELGRVFGR